MIGVSPTRSIIRGHSARRWQGSAGVGRSTSSLVTYQGCRENTVCYRRHKVDLTRHVFHQQDEVLVSYQGCGENKICHSHDHEA